MHKDISLQEYYDKYLKTDPTEWICKCCGKPTKFESLTKGYHKYCSRDCVMKDNILGEENIKTRQENLLKTYGIKSTFELPGVRDKAIQSIRHTVKINGKAIRKKIEATNLKKYGVKTALFNKEVKAKSEATLLERYNTKHISQNKDIMQKIQRARSKTMNSEAFINNWRNKFKDSFSKKLLNVNCTLLEIINNEDIKFKCNICNSEFTYCRRFVFSNLADISLTPCTKCLPKHYHYSIEEKDLLAYIKSILPDNNIIENTKDILDNKHSEIDIFIPDLNIAIEYNGIYFHSSEFVSNNLHINKLTECNSKGIRLITIFSDEWLLKPDIVKSRLNSIFGKNLNRIYARNCEIIKLSSNQAKEFCDINHIQGGINSSYAYGLVYNNEIVSIMNFGKSRFNPKEYELLRFCNKLNTTVIGGASRLFKAFINDANKPKIEKIVSYADRRWSDGNLYYKLGFTLDSIAKPGYYYLNPDDNYKHRESRIIYQKARLVQKGFDASKTEEEIMKDRGYKRIYDCGQFRFVYNLL